MQNFLIFQWFSSKETNFCLWRHWKFNLCKSRLFHSAATKAQQMHRTGQQATKQCRFKKSSLSRLPMTWSWLPRLYYLEVWDDLMHLFKSMVFSGGLCSPEFGPLERGDLATTSIALAWALPPTWTGCIRTWTLSIGRWHWHTCLSRTFSCLTNWVGLIQIFDREGFWFPWQHSCLSMSCCCCGQDLDPRSCSMLILNMAMSHGHEQK